MSMLIEISQFRPIVIAFIFVRRKILNITSSVMNLGTRTLYTRTVALLCDLANLLNLVSPLFNMFHLFYVCLDLSTYICCSSCMHHHMYTSVQTLVYSRPIHMVIVVFIYHLQPTIFTFPCVKICLQRCTSRTSILKRLHMLTSVYDCLMYKLYIVLLFTFGCKMSTVHQFLFLYF